MKSKYLCISYFRECACLGVLGRLPIGTVYVVCQNRFNCTPYNARTFVPGDLGLKLVF